MNRNKNIRKSQVSVHNTIFWATGIILILTMLSIWLVSGLFAKYVISGHKIDSATVAKTGIGTMELLEHEAKLDNGIYVLDEKKEVTENTYNRVIPGVDIAKDPFVRLKLQDAEVDYELYITVTEEDFPTYQPTPESKPVKTVTYSVITKEIAEAEGIDYYWILQEDLSKESKGIYVYKYSEVLQPGTTYDDIYILKENMLYVSEHYVGNSTDFTLTFSAWLVQVGTN